MLTKFRAGVFRWLRSGYDALDSNVKERGIIADRGYANTMAASDGIHNSRRINFNVVAASGGTVIEVRNDTDVKGPSVYNTYVCPEGDDLAETLSKIVTLESMR